MSKPKTNSTAIAGSSLTTCCASDWRAEYREKHPLPKFTHWMGMWWADGSPIMESQSMGKTLPIHREFPIEDVPDHVVGAYCGINRLCWGNFVMAHDPKCGGGISSHNASVEARQKEA
jgi:hypothetical protein